MSSNTKIWLDENTENTGYNFVNFVFCLCFHSDYCDWLDQLPKKERKAPG